MCLLKTFNEQRETTMNSKSEEGAQGTSKDIFTYTVFIYGTKLSLLSSKTPEKAPKGR